MTELHWKLEDQETKSYHLGLKAISEYSLLLEEASVSTLSSSENILFHHLLQGNITI